MPKAIKSPGSFRVVLGIGGVLVLSACSSSDPSPVGASGGAVGLGGAPLGGNTSTVLGGTSAGGSAQGFGGQSSGGNQSGNGGTATGGSSNTGGSANTNGGTTVSGGASTGGAIGGASTSVGGASTGGSKATGGTATVGGATSTGGSKAVGGAGNGGVSTGGAVSAGGVVNTGGKAGGGASTGGVSSTGGTTGTDASCPGADATELALVKAWLNNTTAVGALPGYAYTNIKSNFPAGAAFDKLACSIAMSCVEFAPMETNWLRKCEAVITSAIVAESSYNPASVVTDSYATRSVSGTTANDPTVGLLQIRFSSTVHDYNYYGPLAKMAAIGCTWPTALTSQADTATFWATAGGATYLSFMQDVACNIGLATWYYFYNATGNGGSSAVWISNYCAGQGVAGTMVVGLLSHLMGGGYTRPADANNAYPWGIECCANGNPSSSSCTGCTGRFAAFMGIGTTASRPSPDPFLETLAPEVSKYCK